MSRTRFLLLLLPLVLGAGPLEAAGGALPPVARWLPRDCVLAVEITRPEAILGALLSPELARAVTSLPAWERLASTSGFRQFLAAVRHLEARLDTDWRTALRELTGGGITLALRPEGAAVLAVDARDAKLLEALHRVVLDLARAEAAKAGAAGRIAAEEYRGVEVWSLGPQEAHAILGGRLLVAGARRALHAVLDLRAESVPDALAVEPLYLAARHSARGDVAARAFANMKILKEHPAAGRGLAAGREPLAALLFAGVLEALRAADWLEAGLEVRGGSVTLRLATGGEPAAPAGAARFALPEGPGSGVLPHLRVPRRIAALSFYRDLHQFYAAKDDLFPERTSGLIFFENMMGIFFSGLDLTEEVLAETHPEVRLVVAEQEYRPETGMPRVQFPAFAAVFRVRHPEAFGQIVEEAWQKALGLVNFSRGQKALPGLIIDRAEHRGTTFTVAAFRPPPEGERSDVDPRYNVRPALARLGEHLILSSTEGLARDLIESLLEEKAHPPAPRAATHTLVELDGRRLASILEKNRRHLVAQNMVEKGHSEPEAEAEVGLLLGLLSSLEEADLALGGRDGQAEALLKLRLRPPRNPGDQRRVEERRDRVGLAAAEAGHAR